MAQITSAARGNIDEDSETKNSEAETSSPKRIQVLL